MKAIMKWLFLIVTSSVLAISTATWGDNGVVQGKLYDTDGKVVGHIQVSCNTADKVMYCVCHLEVKVHLQGVEPSTLYEGKVFIGTGGTCLMGPIPVELETNSSGAGKSHDLWGWRELPEECPECIQIYLQSETGEVIVSERLACVHVM